jgi:hypothetical protein
VDTAGTGIFESQLREQMYLNEAKLTYYLEKLIDPGLILGTWVKETPNGLRSEWRYWATKAGRRFIFDLEVD